MNWRPAPVKCEVSSKDVILYALASKLNKNKLWLYIDTLIFVLHVKLVRPQGMKMAIAFFTKLIPIFLQFQLLEFF